MSAREVSLEGGSPWGFRMHGGIDQHQPLRISRVNPGSKAAQQGVREGDLISSINGRSTRELTNGEAHGLLRNAGDHLKLGLNQDNGSPKRRIYKSSLQENTSIDTIKKITTKTTTNRHIISTETRKSGTDAAKNELGYKNQNGNLKTNFTNQENNSEKKFGKNIRTDLSSADNLDYATDSESTSYFNKRMPCGSRNRRSRRNHHRKRFQRSSTPPNDNTNDSNIQNISEEQSTSINRCRKDEVVNEETKDLKDDEALLTLTTDRLCPEDLPFIENLSMARGRLMRRSKIEKKFMSTDTQICEITTIRNAAPLEAKFDYLPEVGIVESSLAKKEIMPVDNECCTVTILEPNEPVEPLPDDIALKVENLSDVKTSLALTVPTKPFEYLEIHEISENQVEFDNTSLRAQQQGIIIEAESDVERDSSFEERKQEGSEDEGDEIISWETEQQLRNFIEGLKLPSSPAEKQIATSASVTNKILTSNVNSSGRDVLRSASKSVRKRAAAALGLYQSQMSQESNRCLDIIQEESESKSIDDDDDTQHIRDFINEEIGKFRRDRRTLGSVSREERESFELTNACKEYDFEKSSIDDTRIVESASVDEADEDADTRLMEIDDKIITDKGNSTPELITNDSAKKEYQNYIDKKKLVCDINVENKKPKESKTILERENKMEGAFAESDNIETFKSFIESLKESIVNDTRLIESRKKEESSEKKCLTSKTDNCSVIEKSINQEKVDNNTVDVINAIVEKNDVIDIPSVNTIVENVEQYSRISETEAASLEPEKCLEVDVAKNTVSNNEDLANDVINVEKQYFKKDEETNKVIKNDKYEKSKEERIINESLLISTDLNSKKLYDIVNSIKADITKSDKIEIEERACIMNAVEKEKSKITDKTIIPCNSRVTNEITNNKSENNNISTCEGTHSCPQTAIEDDNQISMNNFNEDLTSKHGKDVLTVEVSENTRQKNQSDEVITPIKVEIIKTEFTLMKPELTSKISNESTNSLNPDISSTLVNKTFMNEKHCSPDFPYCTRGERKFSELHQRLSNNFELEDQVEEVKLIKSLLIILSDNESTREDVENLLLQFNLAKLSPNIRNIIDDLMASQSSFNNISTSSEGYIGICNDLYDESQSTDNKIGTAKVPSSLDAVESTASNNNEMKNSMFSRTSSSIPEYSLKPEISATMSPSSPAQKTESCNSETLTGTIVKTVCEKTVIKLEPSKNLSNVTEIKKNDSQMNDTNGQGQPQQDLAISTSSLNINGCSSASCSVTNMPMVADLPAENSSNEKCGTKPNDETLTSDSNLKLISPGGEIDNQTSTIENIESSIELASYRQDADYLYYIPVDQTNLNVDCDNNNEESIDSKVLIPDSLKNLCTQKILSLANNYHELRKILIPQYESAEGSSTSSRIEDLDIENCKMSDQSNCDKKSSSKQELLEAKEANRLTSNTWTGVPTKENPKVLVCFSPSQQKSVLKTSADDLLDLHKKFINRRGYHHEHSHSVSPPKYFIDISPKEAEKFQNPTTKQTKSSNRILNIIKSNSNSAKSKFSSLFPYYSRKGKEASKSHDNNHERLRTTKLSDWLFFARRTLPSDKALRPASGDVLIERRTGEAKQQQQQQQECPDKAHNYQNNYDVEKKNKCVNGALTDATSESQIRNTTPTLRKSPISFNSAIIEKSRCSQQENTRPPTVVAGVGIDPRYVNPALIIEEKPEDPGKIKRTVTVDKECIDTRSIFDRASPVSRKNYLDISERFKEASRAEMMANLRTLQTDIKNVDKRRRYSLPQEYFDKQLQYIERLEHQLKQVILAEEEKRMRKVLDGEEIERSKNSTTTRIPAELQIDDKSSKDNDDIAYKDEWMERAKKCDCDHFEEETQRGSWEINEEVKREGGIYSKQSCEKIEEKIERKVIIERNKDENTDESKLKSFLRDFNDENLGKVPVPIEVTKRPKTNDLSEKRKSHLKIERPVSIAAIPTNGEVFRKQMYDEYVHKVLEREERKHHKIIKISSHSDLPIIRIDKHHDDYSCLNKVEQEFIEKAKSRLSKFGIRLDESETEGASSGNNVATSMQEESDAKFLVDGREIKDARSLPKHLQEFLKLSATKDDEDKIMEKNDELKTLFLDSGNSFNKGTKRRAVNSLDLLREIDDALKLSKGFLLGKEMIAPTFKALSAKPGVWSPGSEPPKLPRQPSPEGNRDGKDESIPPVWTPSSAGPSPVAERKEFRPVPFESPILSRKKSAQQSAAKADTIPPPWQDENQPKEASQVPSQSIPSRIVNSYSAPSQGLNALSTGAPRLPRAQNPTITLLQKAREGHLPKGAAYLDDNDHFVSNKSDDKPLLSSVDSLYSLKKDYESEQETDNFPTQKVADPVFRKYEGIGPTTRGGIPIVLRSEVKENNQAKWYKQMYDSLHRAPKNDDYVTIRYKPHRGSRTGYSGTSSGYLSEPEPRSYSERSCTLDNRRHRQRNKENDFSTCTLPRPSGRIDGHYSPETYHLQPGRIEDYVPGNCSIQEKESKEPTSDLTWAKRKWWDEVMDIFDGWLDEIEDLQGSIEGLPSMENQEHTSTGSSGGSGGRRANSGSHHGRDGACRPTGTRSLRGSSAQGRLYPRSRPNGDIRRDLELNEEQQRLRQSRLLESLFELAAGGTRPRSGSTGDSERRLIRPLGDWTSRGHRHHQTPRQNHPAVLSSSASSSSSVTNSSSNGTSNHAAIAPSSSSLLPFEQPNIHSPKSYMTHALKESGYESDSTLVFRRREDASPLSPLEQRIAYKTVQKGGDVPLHGLRKPAPERPKDDTEIEYFPISPTLTRIRIHRKGSSYSSTTTSPVSSTSSMNFSRIPVISMASSASKQSQISASKIKKNCLSFRKNIITDTSSYCFSSPVPSPPKRKSSRNNRTLKLYSNSSKLAETSQNHHTRHEQCFTKIPLLKDKLNTNLEKQRKDRGELQKQKTIRSSSISPVSLSKRSSCGASPISRSRRPAACLSPNSWDSDDIIVNRAATRISYSSSPTSKSPKITVAKASTAIKPTVDRISNSSKDLRKVGRVCQHVSRITTTNSAIKQELKVRRTKREQEESCKRLSRSTANLISPVEVRRIIQRQKEQEKQSKTIATYKAFPVSVIKHTPMPLASLNKNNSLKFKDKSLKVNVANTIRGREIVKKSRGAEQLSTPQKQMNCVSDRACDLKRKKIRDKIPSNRKTESKQVNSNEHRAVKELVRDQAFVMRSKSRRICKDSNKTNSGHVEISERMTRSEILTPTLTVDLLRQHQEATMSDSFFQHLFLRDIFLTSSQTNPLRKSSVLDRARMFQEIDYNDNYKSEPSLKSLNIYLSHKRPVSNSRFRNWERESLSSRSSSPFAYRFNKFDSLLRVDEFGSSGSLRGRSPDLTRECPTERSLSEPPMKSLTDHSEIRMHRSPIRPTARSPSTRKIQIRRQDNSDNFSETAIKKSRAKSASEVNYTCDYKENLGYNVSLTRSTSSLMNFPIDREDYQHYILEKLRSRRKSKRYKDLYDFYTSLERIKKLEETTSSGEARPRLKNEEIIDYERWKEIRTKEKAEDELKNLYNKLQIIQREKDFLFSTRDIGRYKWRGDSSLRCKERSVENIREQFRKLENEESELEALRQREIASKKDTYKPLWRGNSVVNVANIMARKAAEKADFDRTSIQASLQRSLGGSNKFWSSLTIEQVTALKNQLNDIYGNDPISTNRKIIPKRSDSLNSVTRISKTNCISGARRDDYSEDITMHPKQQQIDTIVANGEKSSLSVSEFEIIVPKGREDASPDNSLGLHVRCHSMIASDHLKRSDDIDFMQRRSRSISRVSSLERSQSDRIPKSSPMSEVEKKRLSLTLGKEMLEKVNKKLTPNMTGPRETRSAQATASIKQKPSTTSKRTSCDSRVSMSEDDTLMSRERIDYVSLRTPNNDGSGSEQEHRVEKVIISEWSRAASGREGIDQIDSATESSDISVRTVVHHSPKKNSLDQDLERENKIAKYSQLPCKLSYSQSLADLKELFGESTTARYRATSPYKSRTRSASPITKAERITTNRNDKERSTSASPDVVASTRSSMRSCPRSRDRGYLRPRSVSPYRVSSPAAHYDSSGSLESLWQRGNSPDPEKYWRTYLKVVRDGSVRRLRAKFESLEDISRAGCCKLAVAPKRFQSDPELARNLLRRATDTSKNYIKPQEIPDVAWLRRKYEGPSGRKRRGGVSPIPRIPWRLEDLTMPHINVISKTVELKDSALRNRTNSVSHKEETKVLESRRAVNRVREMFEQGVSPDSKTSILGQMFTSAPNVHELRDIAPYLAGRWVAHQYPSRYDNSRSLSSPPDLSRKSESSTQAARTSITPPIRKKRLASSGKTLTLATRPRTPVSILKQSQPNDAFANQPFDPSKHRPSFRYQPPPPPLPVPPPPKLKYKSRAWCPPLPTYSARPTVVTFQGPLTRPRNA